MKHTKKIAIIGGKKSGKTSIAELLIGHLTNLGFKVGSLKHIHHADFTIDREGSDTWRHRHAGSKVTAYISPREAGLLVDLKKEPESLEEILCFIKMSDLDVLIMEGFHRLIAKRLDVGKIVAFRDRRDLEERLQGTQPPILAACTFNESAFLLHNNVKCLLLPRDKDELLKIVEQFMKSQ